MIISYFLIKKIQYIDRYERHPTRTMYFTAYAEKLAIVLFLILFILLFSKIVYFYNSQLNRVNLSTTA